MEPVRPQVDAYLLDWITRQPLRRQWFFEQRDGNCRLMGSFAVRLSETAPIWSRAVAPIAEWVAQQLWSTTRKRAESDLPPTHLTQTHRREAKGIRSKPILPVAPRAENLCRGCGQSISAGRKHCANCAVSPATERLAVVSRLGRAAAQTPEASVKQAASQRRHSRARSSWNKSGQPAWLTAELFSQKVQPLLPNVATSVIRSSIGVSRWYASRIRQGYTASEALGGAGASWDCGGMKGQPFVNRPFQHPSSMGSPLASWSKWGRIDWQNSKAEALAPCTPLHGISSTFGCAGSAPPPCIRFEQQTAQSLSILSPFLPNRWLV